MQFYTYSYLVQQTHTVNKIYWIIIFVLFLVLLVIGFFWIQKKLDYRLKEVGLLIIVLLLLLGGIQLNIYNNDQASDNQYSQITNLLNRIAKSLHVEVKKIKMNRTDLSSNPIIEVSEKFYLIHLSDDKENYLIEEIKIENQKDSKTIDLGG